MIFKVINIVDCKLDPKKDKELERCFNLIRKCGSNPDLLLPHTIPHILTFTITKSNSAFANLIRTCLVNHIPVNTMSLDISTENLFHDDKFILNDFLQKNIGLIPINQDLSEEDWKNIHISLRIQNTTDKIIILSTKDFIVKKKKKEINVSTIMPPTIPLTKLRPGKSIIIQKINIEKGLGVDDNGKYSFLANLYYDITDMEPLDVTKSNTTGTSSTNQNPSDFIFKCKTYGNINPKTIITKLRTELMRRVIAINNELNNIPENQLYTSQILSSIVKENITYITIKFETLSMGKIYSRYCYELDPSIKYTNTRVIHPSIASVEILIRHSDPINLIKKAGEAILKDIMLLQ